MEKGVLTTILKEYDQQCALHTEFTEKVKKLVEELVRENGARVHSITSRVKDKTDLKRKLESSEEEYRKLSDVTDISGIRIITYFADEVDKVADIIQREFGIDVDDSIDKRVILDPDRFGYLSLHYIAKLTPARLKLTEYQRFSDCKVEMQIRSILQHTWAEIEHDLGYKGKYSVPKEIRRRFSRLAGLLELADDEFSDIRDNLLEYEKNVPKLIRENPSLVSIDKASLTVFIRNSSLVRRIDRRIASVVKGRVYQREEFAGELVERLHYVDLETIGDVDSLLHRFEKVVPAFSANLLTGRTKGNLSAGICLFHLCYVSMAHKNSIEGVSDFLKKFFFKTTKGTTKGTIKVRKSAADRIFSAYSKAIAESK